MGKNKKRRIRTSDQPPPPPKIANNPLLQKQEEFLKTLTEVEREEFFSPEISSERRAELWMEQADLGEELVNKHAWAIPNPMAIRILKEFSPLVEIGCGANAYWCRMMKQAGMDVVGYDTNIDSGGKISKQDKNKNKQKTENTPSYLKQGGPEVLSAEEELAESDRTLFLCYPDEDDEVEDEDDDVDDEPISMGAQCLEHFQGTHIIHVGELFLDSNLSLEQAPFGRSSAPEFQQRLASEYHCLIKVQLPNWLHVRDSISVWKRSETSTIVFAAEDSDDDEEEDEEVEYRHIPRNERLPMNLAAPKFAHLLPKRVKSSFAKAQQTSTDDVDPPSKKTVEKKPEEEEDVEESSPVAKKAKKETKSLPDKDKKHGSAQKSKKVEPSAKSHDVDGAEKKKPKKKRGNNKFKTPW